VDALTEVAVPDIGDFTDVPVTEILVTVGATVALEDPLIAIESDKATMEIPAPAAGVVSEILVALGDKVSEGTPIVRLAAAEETDAPEANASEEPSSTEAAEASADTDPSTPSLPQTPSPTPSPSPAPSSAQAVEPDAGQPAEESERDRDSVYAGPAVRRLARERGIDLRTVTGSGRRGRIVVEDLDRAPSSVAGSGGGSGAAGGGGFDSLGLAAWPSIDFSKYGEIERVPLTRIQQSSAANLARNWIRIPHVTHNEDADITDLEAFRKKLNGEQSEVKVTIVALLLKAVAAALKAHPQLNSSLDGEELVLKRYYHLGFAADTPNGLVVPVVRDVERKGILELAGEVSELSQRARAGKLGPVEMSGSTFTISSLGGIGGTSFTPIVNAPEVAILGVVRAVTRPVWDGQQFQPRLMLPLSLSYDHRVIDGAAAARFCVELRELLGDMRRILL
jgi:pyruvate dehydrogenase E2 component (dihydrolipoamide acetyltransferase)